MDRYSTPVEDKIVVCAEKFFGTPALMIPTLKNIDFTMKKIIMPVDSIAPNAAAGPYSFHPKFLKYCRKELALPLKLLWTESSERGSVPPSLKTGIITPIHKGGSKGQTKNYRPVTVTSHLIKIAEKVIRNKLVEHLKQTSAFKAVSHPRGDLTSTLPGTEFSHT